MISFYERSYELIEVLSDLKEISLINIIVSV